MRGRSSALATSFWRLAHWQQDADLAPLRDAKELAALPEKERAAWQQLWADVAALLKKVQFKD